MAALLIPMAMNAETKVYGQLNKKADKVVVSTTPTAVKATKSVKFNAVPKADVPEGYASVTLTAGNVWDDGTGYQMLLDEDAIAYGTIIPETGGLTASGDATAETYAEFEYKIPENADGAMTTQNIVIENSVTILIPAGTYDWCITNPTPGDRIWIASDNGSVGGRYDDFEFASGAAYEFVVSLGGQNDQVDLVIDDPTAPAIPTDVTVEPTATTGVVSWVPGVNNDTWNLRWRPWVDPALMNKLWDFPLDGYEDQIEGWQIYDADGDGNNWGLAYSSSAQDDVCFTSASYSGGALTPDNWLFTPAVGMGGTLKFDAWQQSASYPDKIMVYVAPADYESLDDFVAVSEFIQPAGTTATNYEIDLSEFEGMGVIAFRHYDCTDQWAIYVDNIAVEIPGAVEPTEWTLCENVANPYTIEGLVPETKYEVQVQGVKNEEKRLTDWTDVVEFTTLPDGGTVEEPTYYLVGSFQGWDTANGVEFVNDLATVDLEENAQFKVITFAEDGSTIWYGGIDETGAGFFLITPELLDVAIQLVDGANFKIEEAGKYDVQLVYNRADVPSIMVSKNQSAINTVGVDAKADNAYYNLLGVKFNNMPTTPGIYIHNGKKVIIK